MNITCPNCQTLYELPDGKIKKPRIKMRCSRCRHGFYFNIPSPPPAPAPAQFEEFTESQTQIPQEFSDIKKADAFEEFASSDSLLPDEFERLQQESTRNPSGGPPITAEEIPIEIDSIMEADDHTGTSGSFVPDIYDDSSASWELSASLIIQDAESIDEGAPVESKAARIAGRAMLSIVASMIVFFVFVAFQNNWSLSFDSLPEQIAGSFTGQASDDLPEAVKGLEIIVHEQKQLEGPHLKLTITGEVINRSGSQRSQVLVKGQLRDLTDAVVMEVKAPCGIVVAEEELQGAPQGAHRKHYTKAGTMHNCALNIEGSQVFQVVFDKLPENYKPGRYNASVQVISAM